MSAFNTNSTKIAYEIQAGVNFMQRYGLKRLRLEEVVLLRENDHIAVVKETVSKQMVKHPVLGFTRTHVNVSRQQCGKVIV